jgi:hypothetical protein
MRSGTKSGWATKIAWTLVAAGAAWAATSAAATTTRVPIVCSRGPSGQHFDTMVTLPRSAAERSTFTVRVDGVPSGTIEHTGLNYIHDIATDYSLPSGTTYVTGSARVVPNTGSANVVNGARVWQDGGKIHLNLPGRVESGSSYTPPSIEFQVTVTGKVGDALALSFLQYRLTANAVIVGDLNTTCDPTPNPFPLGSTTVTAAAP